VLLRPGAIATDEIERVVDSVGRSSGERIASPGQMASHYAPIAPLRLNAQNVERGEALLAFGPGVPKGAARVRNLSEHGDLKEAAANLFAMLRELDASSARRIAVMPIPESGLGEAINDRLRRAAAPRDPL
jgi:L-threonylcarbamoyladenylate synthase